MYRILESAEPGFLRKDVYRHANENNSPLDFLAPLSDMDLLELGAAQLYVLPRSQKANPRNEKTPNQSLKKLYNWSATTTHTRPQRPNE